MISLQVVNAEARARLNEARQSSSGGVLKAKRHSPAEIAAKLAQAARLAVAGKRQSEIATALGVSIMTLHRWRKPDNPWAARMGGESRDSNNLLVELQTENRRLRDLVMNLLLEKIKLEESTSLRAA